MFPRNLFVIGWLATAMAVVLLIYGYIALVPYLFIGGLALATLMACWISYKINTKALVIFVILSIIIALIDEYIHTAAGILTYYDGQTPSFLTVIGWPIFILMIIACAELVMSRVSFPEKFDSAYVRLAIGLIPIVLIPVLILLQNYMYYFDWTLIVVYLILGVVSLYFIRSENYGWNLTILICSVLIGGLMEYIGALEGLWSYGGGEPMVFFIAFTWTIRTWAILGVLTLLKIRTPGSRWTLWLPRNLIAEEIAKIEAKESSEP